jgi:hypothetical protein
MYASPNSTYQPNSGGTSGGGGHWSRAVEFAAPRHRYHGPPTYFYPPPASRDDVIRPWSKLLPNRPPVPPMHMEELSPRDREMYLRDFMPPSSHETAPAAHHRTQHASPYDPHNEELTHSKKPAAWPIVST